jgi:hypothetical protein
VLGVTRGRRIIPAVAAITAVVLFLAGAVAWDMTSSVRVLPSCPTDSLCLTPYPDGHHLHPLRAEFLWAASAVFLLVAALGTGLRQRRGHSSAEVVSG